MPPSPRLAAGSSPLSSAIALAKPAPEYELILMLDPEAPDERRDEIAVSARQRIEAGATLKQERTWGLRKMAYEIERRNEADYRFFRFEQGAGVLDDLNHNLRITDGVLRFRIYKVDPRAPVIDPPPPISLAATAGDRPPGRGRRDDRGGGYDSRPPRAPEPEAESAAGEAASEPAPEAASAEPPTDQAPPAADAAEPQAPEVPAPAEPGDSPAAPEPSAE